ncbi:MAG: response regulator [Candidatus Krumholzibacteriota bacterium]|nr:response regulator [Candidatus Krumholzibacteriota bacterium]
MIKGNVLVVDDDPNVVEIITESLKNRGYVTESSYNGEDALKKFDWFKPDLVILDVLLPRLDGFKVCDEIRSRDIHRDVPVIMISGNAIPDTMMEGFKSGAQDYIKKPFSVKEVLAKVDSFLSQASGRKNLRAQNELLEGEIQKGQEDYKRINRVLKKKVLDMRALFDLSQDLNRLQDPEEVMHIFFLTIIGQFGSSPVALFSATGSHEDYLTYSGGKGIQDSILSAFRLSRSVGLAKYILRNQEVLFLGSDRLEGDVKREADFMRNLGFSHCCPLVVKSDLTGIVFIGGKINKQKYSKNELELIKSICTSATTGLENARLYAQLQETYLSTIKVLVSTIEAKDSYTRGHTERVGRYANLLAEEIGLDKKSREIVSFGAALHDIGKLGVYENILNKPGELTDHEWEIVRSHPEVGANIIKNMKFLESACDLVRHHHERLDGKGYPDGLKGDEISLGARIVAVADSFDAITSDRPYRKAHSYAEAIEQLRTKTEKFDQDIVQKLVRLIETGRITEST